MKRIIFILLLLLPVCLFADTWFVAFKDKVGTIGEISRPAEYLSQRAIERRHAQNIPIDSTDLPVSIVYLEQLQALGVEILYTTKWLNGAVIRYFSENSEQPDSSDHIALISHLPFVDYIEHTSHSLVSSDAYRSLNDSSKQTTIPLTKSKLPTLESAITEDPLDYCNYAKDYLEMLRLDSLQQLGLCGEGKLISVFDNGFYRADELPVYASMRERIIGEYNIVDPTQSVFGKSYSTHGACVLSLLSGMIESADNGQDMIIGTATQAQYCLFVTEDDQSESLLEVDNIVRAFEIADSIGSDIVSISLGYNKFDDTLTNFSYNDLDGYTIRCSRAATMAADKGMLVCVAAGNEGNSSWRMITAPADAHNIITIGGVDNLYQHSSFSSFGPTADGRIKPEVCALATKVPIYYPTSFIRSNGTSFATPIIAGAAATLWAALPQLSAQEIRERIIRYSNRYDTPDNEYGYGIPNFLSAYYDMPTNTELFKKDEENNLLEEGEVYTISGLYIGKISDISTLSSGIFIIRDGKEVEKIAR